MSWGRAHPSLGFQETLTFCSPGGSRMHTSKEARGGSQQSGLRPSLSRSYVSVRPKALSRKEQNRLLVITNIDILVCKTGLRAKGMSFAGCRLSGAFTTLCSGVQRRAGRGEKQAGGSEPPEDKRCCAKGPRRSCPQGRLPPSACKAAESCLGR
uniref:Uncharacterized protein n=1 Tax=Micrurus spixii TaxID=129469 RepID=A0A2D4MXJ5_9SAUR